MKNVLFNSVLVAFVLLVASCGKQPEAKVEVMSFNIRLDPALIIFSLCKHRIFKNGRKFLRPLLIVYIS